ncbi:MAG: hypothetical protein AAFP69_17225, partial [Planctomycetota bacterium]
MLVGPVLPASLMLGVMLVYAMIAMVGLIGGLETADLEMDTPDVDLPDLDVPDVDLPDLDLPEIEVPDVEVPGLDVDVDVGVDAMGADIPGVEFASSPTLIEHALSLGGSTLRWSNIPRIPLVVWGGIFTTIFWCVSYFLWH